VYNDLILVVLRVPGVLKVPEVLVPEVLEVLVLEVLVPEVLEVLVLMVPKVPDSGMHGLSVRSPPVVGR
jgi:hypothetical protein